MHMVCDSWSEGTGFESCVGYFDVDICQWCLTGLSKAWLCAKLSMVTDMSITVTKVDIKFHSPITLLPLVTHFVHIYFCNIHLR